jgi:hypothetical protein
MIDPMSLIASTVLFPALAATCVLLALAYSLYGWLVKYNDGTDSPWYFYSHLAVTFVSLFVFIVNGFFRDIYGNLFTYVWSFF